MNQKKDKKKKKKNTLPQLRIRFNDYLSLKQGRVLSALLNAPQESDPSGTSITLHSQTN
jgi:hypothetical protein